MGHIETQEHCLSVCQSNMPAMKARHDKVMERLVGAIPDSLGTKFLDQTVPECSGMQRPDIVILHEGQKKAYLIDVTCPCEYDCGKKAEAGQVRRCQGKASGQRLRGIPGCFCRGDSGDMGSRKRQPDAGGRDWSQVRNPVQEALLSGRYRW